MAMTFNADEVLAIAEQIERNGGAFYRRAAEIAPAGGVRKLLAELAAWEKGHEALFASMREGLSAEDRASALFDPGSDGELYLRAAADTHVFSVHADPAALLAPGDAPLDILKKALAFERDSILFFVGLSKAVPARLGAKKVQSVVDEEMNHVAYLTREMGRLGG
jgi:rubrerythrin